MKSKVSALYSLSEDDRRLFHEGMLTYGYQKFGAHTGVKNRIKGTWFSVWAPKAKSVSVLTDANSWDVSAGKMRNRGGVWELFVNNAMPGDKYRFYIQGKDGLNRFKSDPYSFQFEMRPANCSVITEFGNYQWHDEEYLSARSRNSVLSRPMAIYEIHLGSWKKDYRLNEDGFLNYRDLADQLCLYLQFMGYTHVELIGICEHPFDGSWGYQCSGFFAPTSRHGSPDDFRYFVEKMHLCGISVILDWVPAHFPKDSFSLEKFDGSALYESSDPLLAEFPEWGTKAFDFSKPEVRSFLMSSAFYWIEEFHIDAIRVDAVSAILYSSFGRQEWRPNIHGGPENLEGMEFLRQLNKTVKERTQAYLIAEDSSILSGITKDVDEGGFGFLLKWSLGWMNDTLRYFSKDPIYRRYHHGELTHTADYAFSENFVLVLSHDEVVHLKHSMLEKMPGTIEEKLGGLKELYTVQFTFPGKKLLFMGQDFAQNREWDENREIDWQLASDFGHRDVLQCVKNLLSIYRKYPVLYSDSDNSATFEWVNRDDADRNIIAYIRRNPWNYDSALLVICNLSPVAYPDYSCGVPSEGYYSRIFSTYDSLPGGGNAAEVGDIPPIIPKEDLCDGYGYRLSYGLRPNEAVIIEFPKITVKPKKEKKKRTKKS